MTLFIRSRIEEKFNNMEKTEKIYIRNRYQIKKVLNRGGFGITYLAEDVELCQEVVLKKYCPTEKVHEKGKRDFLREARILSSLFEVKEVVKVFDYFEEGNEAYIVMEYVSGITLRQYTENKVELMSFEAAWTFLLPVMNALQKVHEKGLIHRDINPDNIIVREDGTLKLIDFGSARHYTEDKVAMTAIVKRGYAPPEQYMKRGKQGPWTDVYSICATIYEMITGVIPQQAIQRQNEDRLYPPSSYGCEISPQQEETLMKGLTLDYKKRHQNIEQLKQSLSCKEESKEGDEKEKQYTQGKLTKKIIIACMIIGLGIIGITGIQKYKNNLKKAQEKVSQEQSLKQYPRNSKEHFMLLNYLVKYGRFKGRTGSQRIYNLPEWTLRKINIRCDTYLFHQKRGEFLSYLRRKGISLKLKEKGYRGDVYIEPYGGTIETYFTYTEVYDIGQGHSMNLIYDIATSEIARVIFYRNSPKQSLDELIPLTAQTILFFSKDWNMPRKKTEEKIKELIEEYEKEKPSESTYSWIGAMDGNVGCRMDKKYGTMLEVFSYTSL